MDENNTPQEEAPQEEPVQDQLDDLQEPQQNNPAQKVMEVADALKAEMHKVLVGNDQLIDLIFTALLTNGNVLLEGMPGLAKTLTVKLFAKIFNVAFNRIQFTPDLMPSDILGTMVYNMQNASYHFRKGPLFSNFILADEINRAPAKTQAALIEIMEEKQVTIEGETHPLAFPLFIIATQNPIEQEGTYRLPEAQLDRFVFKLNYEYPQKDEEVEILMRFKNDFSGKSAEEVKPIFSAEDIRECVDIVEQVFISDELVHYIANLVVETRQTTDLYMGGSPRASLSIMKSAKALAAIRGRFFVTPDDIRDVSIPVLGHRLILNPEKEIEGVEIGEVIEDIIKKVEIPR